MNFTSTSSKSGLPAESTALSGDAQLKLRDCVNHIVTSCELLKMEIGQAAGEAGLAGPLDQLKAEAVSLLQDLQMTAPGRSGQRVDGDPSQGQRLLLRAKETQERIRQIQVMVRGHADAGMIEDLLELEFTVHQFLKLFEQIIAPVAEAPRLVPGLLTPDDARLSIAGEKQVVLVADDDEANRDLLARILRRDKYDVIFAVNGHEVLQMIDKRRIDLVLLDLVMPGASGFEVLRAAKSGQPAKDIPIIMISGVDDTEKVVACIETGADDYVLKPFNATLLRTRVRALLDRKQSRDLEREQTEQLKAALLQLEAERQTTEKLLLSILPRKVCEELQLRGSVSPTYFEDVTIIFTDFVSFTSSTEKLTADELVTLLNEYFTAFDTIVDRYGLEKLKTVGDSYIFLSGLPERTPSHPVDALLASIEMLQYVMAAQQSRPNPGWSMRIGIHTGSVIAGVVGTSKFAFDVWGDAVNFASRMVMSGAANKINVSERAFQRLKDFFSCTPRGLVGIKGNRQAEMYFVDDVLPSLLEEKASDRPAPFRERYSRYFQRELRAFPPRLNADGSSFATIPSQLAELDTRQERP